MTEALLWPDASIADPRLALDAGRVDCWAVWLPAAPAAADFVGLLSERERAAAARFRFERDRIRYVRRHAALRLIVARYLGVAPVSLVFAEEANGRPVLADAGLHFNLSDSGDLALVAVSPIATIGVDVEALRDIPDLADVARDHFAEAEFHHVRDLPPEQQRLAFYTTWTRKEAFVKAIGEGLSYPLKAFTTGRTDRPPLLEIAGVPRADWTMANLAPATGYAGALAIRQPGIAIRTFHADWAWLMAAGAGSARR
jgi:4'-phosphopantetheinyl transferase